MSLCLSLHSLGGLRGAQLLAILVVPDPRRGSTVAAAFPGTDTVFSQLDMFSGNLGGNMCGACVCR